MNKNFTETKKEKKKKKKEIMNQKREDADECENETPFTKKEEK